MPIDAQTIAHTKVALYQTLNSMRVEAASAKLALPRAESYAQRLNDLAKMLVGHVTGEALDKKISAVVSQLLATEHTSLIQHMTFQKLKYTLRYLNCLFTPTQSLTLKQLSDAMVSQLREWIDHEFTHGKLKGMYVNELSGDETTIPDLLNISSGQEGIIPLYFHALSLVDQFKRTMIDPALSDLDRAQHLLQQLQKPLPDCSDEKLIHELHTFCHHASHYMQKQIAVISASVVAQLSASSSHEFNQAWFTLAPKDVNQSEAEIKNYIALTIHTLETYIKQHFVIGEFLHNSFKNSSYFGKFTDMLAELKAIQQDEKLTEKQRFREIFNKYFTAKVATHPEMAELIISYLRHVHAAAIDVHEPNAKKSQEHSHWQLGGLIKSTAKGLTHAFGLFQHPPKAEPLPPTTLMAPKPL